MAVRQGSLSDWRRSRRGTASVPQVEFSAGSAHWNHRGHPPSKTNWSCYGGKGHCSPLQRLVMSVLEHQCLVLNRSWQAVNIITVQAALSKRSDCSSPAGTEHLRHRSDVL